MGQGTHREATQVNWARFFSADPPRLPMAEHDCGAHLVIMARMAQERVRVGDAVMLKSGGPVMTVRAVSQSLAYCAWRAGERFHSGTFEMESLEVVDHPERPDRSRDTSAGPAAG